MRIRAWNKYLIGIIATCLVTAGSASAKNLTDDLAALNLSRDTLKSYLDAEDFKTALSAAEGFLAIAERVYQKGSFETAAPRHNLGIIQQELGLLADAKDNFVSSIRIVENTLGEYSSMLVVSLSQLGMLYYQTGDYAEASTTFRRAQHITHRNDGVYTLDQLPIVDWISRINLASNDTNQADIQQKFYYRINEENYGAHNPKMIPALTKLGNWLRRSGQHRQARSAFSEIVDIMEISDNYSQLALLPALRAISSILYSEGVCCPDEPLDRVLEITVNDPTTDKADELEAVIQLADMSLVKKKESKARRLYQRALMMLGKEDGKASKKALDLFGSPSSLGVNRADDVVQAYRKAINITHDDRSTVFVKANRSDSGSALFFAAPKPAARELIGAPLLLCYPQVLDLVKKRSRNNLSNYYVKLDYSVDEDGRVQNVEILDSNSPVKLNRYVINMLYSTRYRPRFDNGEPVETNHLNLHQTFADSGVRIKPDDPPIAYSTTTVHHGCQILAGK